MMEPMVVTRVTWRKIGLRLAQSFALLLGTLAFGDVARQSQSEPMTTVPERSDAKLDRELGPIFLSVRSLEGDGFPGGELAC
jgi:hypothetical protein